MAEGKTMRLSQAARKLNVGPATLVAHRAEKGSEVENKPHVKITMAQFDILAQEFAAAAMDKEEASEIAIGESYTDTSSEEEPKPTPKEKKAVSKHELATPQLPGVKVVGKTVLEQDKKPAPATPDSSAPAADIDLTAPVNEQQPPAPVEKITVEEQENLKGLTVLGKMDLPKAEERKFQQVAS